MRSVIDHVRELTKADPRPWLVVGKGPTSDYLCRVDLAHYHVFTLNHACQLATPAVAHFVDVDALEECRHLLHSLRAAGTHVVMPWHPHVHNKANAKTLEDYPWTAEFGTHMLSYNATTANTLPRNHALPHIRLRYFSAVAAFNILVATGLRTIYSIGVDGGSEYGQSFDKKTKLSNGRRSFDVQMPEISYSLHKNKCTWVRLEKDRDGPTSRTA